jgi:heme/copper-type cytochrome/quinol oxidase subunit 2
MRCALKPAIPKFNYEIACNQICGRGHFAMKLNIIVDEPEDYVAWVASQKPFAEQNPEVLASFQQQNKKSNGSAGDPAQPDTDETLVQPVKPLASNL